MADILEDARWAEERMWAAIVELRNDATASQVGMTEAEVLRAHDTMCMMSDRLFALRAALIEVVAAVTTQLENTGRGIEPSERVSEAFHVAEGLTR